MALQAQHPPNNAPFAAMPVGANSGEEGDEEAFLDQILRLRDAVLAGSHPGIKLSEAAIESLKSSISAANNFEAVSANRQLLQSSSFPVSSPASLDPIFLQKSDNLVRAEGHLKRQRIERELQAAKDREPTAESLPHIDVDSVLLDAWQRVHPVSGLKTPDKEAGEADTSFDENDYYSSQVQSDWSSEGEVHPDPDQNVGAPLHTGNVQTTHSTAASSFNPPYATYSESAAGPNHQPQTYDHRHDGSEEEGEIEDDGDDEDDYVPPDADAFDSVREDHSTMLEMQRANEADDEDDSEYEPGDITQDSATATPHYRTHQKDSVPIIRNHLTHLAAPQPNRVSPLTTANIQGGRVELELVNGRPEVRQKPQQASRASTMSPPPGPRAPGMSKKAMKKRKLELDAQNAQNAQNGNIQKKGKKHKSHAASNARADHLTQPSAAPQNGSYRQGPSTHHAQYSALRYEYEQPLTPTRVASSSTAFTVPRGNSDLRRVASLHQARAASPDFPQPVAPYHPDAPRYAQDDFRVPAHPHQIRAQSPPHPTPQRIVVDQYGNRYVAAEPMPPPPPLIATPIERHPAQDGYYERAPTRVQSAYPGPAAYGYGENNMPPPPAQARQEYQPHRDQRLEYVNPGRQQYGAQAQRYDMGPTTTREQTSPVFTPARAPRDPGRVYSMRPPELAPEPDYVRQPSVAPTQYYRPQPPVRAVSVMPASEYGHPPFEQQTYNYPPAPVQYVDQYGNPVRFA